MKIPHLSVSRTNTWAECQQKYKFRYHLEIPAPEPEQPYFLYGKAVHKIIELYTLGKGELNINEVVKKVIYGDIDDEELKGKDLTKELSSFYMNRLGSEISQFMRINEKIGFSGQIEWGFNFDLDPPHGRYLHGFIDRLIINKDECYILDWKTTKKGPWRKTSQTASGDLQLRCYALIVNRILNIPAENITAALYYLDGGTYAGSKFTQKILDDTHSRMLSIHKKIEDTYPEEVRGNVGKHCTRCEFKSFCSFYNSSSFRLLN